jgi:ATPase family associated with various cellular activities (AAA)
MENLNDYLRDQYAADKFEINKVDKIASDVLKTILHFDVDGAWPYEVAVGDLKPSPSDSHSTSAMNLFAMGVAYGQILDAVLAPVGHLPKDASDGPKAIVRDLKALHRRITDLRSKQNDKPFSICYSGTYGPDDPFTILWLLELLRDHHDDESDLKTWGEEIAKFAGTRVDYILGGDKPSLMVDGGMDHLFPKMRWIQIYDRLTRDKRPRCSYVPRLVQQLEARLHQHLSYFSIPDSSYDAAELAFAMESILLLDRTALTAATVERCWQVLSESQAATPYWRPLRPFVANRQGMVLLPLSVEIANSVIRSCRILEGRDRPHDHLGHAANLLRKYTQWLYARRITWESNGETLTGWHSEYAEDPDKIHTWETSQVLLFLLQYSALLDSHRAERSLALARLDVAFSSNDEKAWNHVVSDECADQIAKEHSVYALIDDNFVKPRESGGSAKDPSETKYSMLIHGPQGTGKSWLAKSLASRLHRPLVRITPSDFIVGGPSEVEAHAKRLFEVLTVQNDIVILFDEIDRLILDRSSEKYGEQDDIFQFMTPSMLTKLQDLRERCRPLFIVTTNYGERIDPAIKRIGRIDEQYLLLPPNKAGRLRILRWAFDEYGKDLGRAVKDEDLVNVVKNTVLGARSEIVLLVQRSVQSGPADASSFAEKLIDGTSAWTPTIQLSDYRSRLTKDDFKRPYTEYFMLMFLLFESERQLTEEERMLWSEVSKDGSLLERYIKDTYVRRILTKHLKASR